MLNANKHYQQCTNVINHFLIRLTEIKKVQTFHLKIVDTVCCTLSESYAVLHVIGVSYSGVPLKRGPIYM